MREILVPTLQQIENQVSNLSTSDLAAFTKWFGDFVFSHYDEWDKQMIEDYKAGRFDAIFADVDADIKAGRVHEGFPRRDS